MKKDHLLRHLKVVEQAAYPPQFRQLQELSSWKELAEYCEGRPRIFVWSTGYCLWTKKEIVDLAATRPVTLARLHEVLRAVRRSAKRVVTLDAREATSWRLIQAAERRGLVEVLSASPWEWGGETFYEVRLNIRPRR